MKPELKSKWLEALRSGKYKQGKGCLLQVMPDGEKRYCCLGVLADLLGATEGGETVTDSSVQPEGQPLSMNFIGGGAKATMLPTSVQLDINLGWDQCSALADRNDQGYSFETIAREIEEKL